MPEPSVVIDHLVFPKCLRWHDGHLWFSDLHDRKVVAVDVDTDARRVVCEVPGEPGGLGWLPDGRLVVVSMRDRRLLRLDGDELTEVADLGSLTDFHLNDMTVDSQGRAYIGEFGFDPKAGDEPADATMTCVASDGDAWIVIEELLFPNGIVVAEESRTLIVAESYGKRLSAYTIEGDGSLSDSRVWADLRPNVPDGICLDAEGAVWVADPVNHGVLRVVQDRGAVQWVPTGDRGAYSCVLGGADGHTLFVATAESSDPERTRELRSARIEALPVEVPAPGEAS